MLFLAVAFVYVLNHDEPPVEQNIYYFLLVPGVLLVRGNALQPGIFISRGGIINDVRLIAIAAAGEVFLVFFFFLPC